MSILINLKVLRCKDLTSLVVARSNVNRICIYKIIGSPSAMVTISQSAKISAMKQVSIKNNESLAF